MRVSSATDPSTYVPTKNRLISAQTRRADDARAHGAEERQVAPAAVDGVQVVRHRVSVEEVLRAAGGGWRSRGVRVLSSRAASEDRCLRARARASLDQPCARDARAAAVQDAGKHSSSGSGLMLMIDGARAAGRKR